MKYNIKRLTLAVMLSALGIIIPLIMPKIVIGPASYTLGSHVPIFIAMFIGWDIALLVGLSGGIGFFLSLGPIVSARAFSHILWAVSFSFIFTKMKDKNFSLLKRTPFNLVLAFFHALLECIVVALFFLGNLNDWSFILYTIILPVGIGGFIHSLVDFEISFFLYKRLESQLMQLAL
ncbi:conserved hypothetical protein [Alteracholeplasma palmae J233]|uniref:Uncharacterized protein n=1 Tax=Alteracholeplasma palmae (strain ATCC 49389 / J233) TaxID=1318466 RepID=U4KK78_ALTPJ|nr:hypothetical protein [Alteracholeplasma palmae]CCV63913.1 conserved hypothetical protein [Alteracholeplasma palmae J233]